MTTPTADTKSAPTSGLPRSRRKSRLIRVSAIAMLAALAATTMAAAARPAAAGSTAHALPRLRSLYVPMPDGVRLSVDVWLPAGTTDGARLPTVLETDRYWRARAYTGGIK